MIFLSHFILLINTRSRSVSGTTDSSTDVSSKWIEI